MSDGKSHSERRRRQNQILLRLTDEELGDLKLKASALSLKPAEYIRNLIGKRGLVQPIMAPEQQSSLIRQIKAIGNNVNQLTYLAHSGRIETVNLETTRKELHALWRLLSEAVPKRSAP